MAEVNVTAKISNDNSRQQNIKEQNSKCIQKKDFYNNDIQDEFIIRTYTVDPNLRSEDKNRIVYICYDIEDLFNHVYYVDNYELKVKSNTDPYTSGVFSQEDLNKIFEQYQAKVHLIEKRRQERQQLYEQQKKELDNKLISAALNGDLVSVKHFLLVGADIHANNELALKAAKFNNHNDVVNYLILKGADRSVLLLPYIQQGLS